MWSDQPISMSNQETKSMGRVTGSMPCTREEWGHQDVIGWAMIEGDEGWHSSPTKWNYPIGMENPDCGDVVHGLGTPNGWWRTVAYFIGSVRTPGPARVFPFFDTNTTDELSLCTLEEADGQLTMKFGEDIILQYEETTDESLAEDTKMMGIYCQTRNDIGFGIENAVIKPLGYKCNVIGLCTNTVKMYKALGRTTESIACIKFNGVSVYAGLCSTSAKVRAHQNGHPMDTYSHGYYNMFRSTNAVFRDLLDTLGDFYEINLHVGSDLVNPFDCGGPIGQDVLGILVNPIIEPEPVCLGSQDTRSVMRGYDQASGQSVALGIYDSNLAYNDTALDAARPMDNMSSVATVFQTFWPPDDTSQLACTITVHANKYFLKNMDRTLVTFVESRLGNGFDLRTAIAYCLGMGDAAIDEYRGPTTMETLINPNPTICYTRELCAKTSVRYDVVGRSDYPSADICLKTDGVNEFDDYCDVANFITTRPTFFGDSSKEQVLRDNPILWERNRGEPLTMTSLKVIESGCKVDVSKMESLSPPGVMGLIFIPDLKDKSCLSTIKTQDMSECILIKMVTKTGGLVVCFSGTGTVGRFVTPQDLMPQIRKGIKNTPGIQKIPRTRAKATTRDSDLINMFFEIFSQEKYVYMSSDGVWSRWTQANHEILANCIVLDSNTGLSLLHCPMSEGILLILEDVGDMEIGIVRELWVAVEKAEVLYDKKGITTVCREPHCFYRINGIEHGSRAGMKSSEMGSFCGTSCVTTTAVEAKECTRCPLTWVCRMWKRHLAFSIIMWMFVAVALSEILWKLLAMLLDWFGVPTAGLGMSIVSFPIRIFKWIFNSSNRGMGNPAGLAGVIIMMNMFLMKGVRASPIRENVVHETGALQVPLYGLFAFMIAVMNRGKMLYLFISVAILMSQAAQTNALTGVGRSGYLRSDVERVPTGIVEGEGNGRSREDGMFSFEGTVFLAPGQVTEFRITDPQGLDGIMKLHVTEFHVDSMAVYQYTTGSIDCRTGFKAGTKGRPSMGSLRLNHERGYPLSETTLWTREFHKTWGAMSGKPCTAWLKRGWAQGKQEIVVSNLAADVYKQDFDSSMVSIAVEAEISLQGYEIITQSYTGTYSEPGYITLSSEQESDNLILTVDMPLLFTHTTPLICVRDRAPDSECEWFEHHAAEWNSPVRRTVGHWQTRDPTMEDVSDATYAWDEYYTFNWGNVDYSFDSVFESSYKPFGNMYKPIYSALFPRTKFTGLEKVQSPLTESVIRRFSTESGEFIEGQSDFGENTLIEDISEDGFIAGSKKHWTSLHTGANRMKVLRNKTALAPRWLDVSEWFRSHECNCRYVCPESPVSMLATEAGQAKYSFKYPNQPQPARQVALGSNFNMRHSPRGAITSVASMNTFLNLVGSPQDCMGIDWAVEATGCLHTFTSTSYCNVSVVTNGCLVSLRGTGHIVGTMNVLTLGAVVTQFTYLFGIKDTSHLAVVTLIAVAADGEEMEIEQDSTHAHEENNWTEGPDGGDIVVKDDAGFFDDFFGFFDGSWGNALMSVIVIIFFIIGGIVVLILFFKLMGAMFSFCKGQSQSVKSLSVNLGRWKDSVSRSRPVMQLQKKATAAATGLRRRVKGVPKAPNKTVYGKLEGAIETEWMTEPKVDRAWETQDNSAPRLGSTESKFKPPTPWRNDQNTSKVNDPKTIVVNLND